MVKAHLTSQVSIKYFCDIIDFIWFIHQLENTVQRRFSTLQLSSQLSQVLNRLVNLPNVLNKGLHITNRQATSQDLQTTQNSNNEISQVR